MVRNTTPEDRERDFLRDLIDKVEIRERCPHLRVDEQGAYCSRDLQGEVTEQRRLVCDKYSLQLWCLDKSRCSKCIWYQGESFL